MTPVLWSAAPGHAHLLPARGDAPDSNRTTSSGSDKSRRTPHWRHVFVWLRPTSNPRPSVHARTETLLCNSRPRRSPAHTSLPRVPPVSAPSATACGFPRRPKLYAPLCLEAKPHQRLFPLKDSSGHFIPFFTSSVLLIMSRILVRIYSPAPWAVYLFCVLIFCVLIKSLSVYILAYYFYNIYIIYLVHWFSTFLCSSSACS